MQRKFAIRSDMEGLSGVVRYEQVTPGTADYPNACETLMGELKALVEGLRSAGPCPIHIYDEHVHGTNIDLSQLPPDVVVATGKPPYREDWAGGLERGFSGLALLGLHAKAGTAPATLAHTYEHDILDLRLNGESAGEIAVEAAIAGELGVPLQLVVADAAGVEEAKRIAPAALRVITKEAQGGEQTICRPAERVREEIREAARRLVDRPPSTAPYLVTPPICLRITLKDNPYREAFARLHPDAIRGGEVNLHGGSVLETWAAYWRMKDQALASLANA